MIDKLGICQWFHYEDYGAVEQAMFWLKELGVRHLRTGISWSDYHRPGGRAWYDWMLTQLNALEILLSIWHTPPSIAEGGHCASPPRRLIDFAEFVWQVEREFGNYFDTLELWNEPNNRYKWDFVQFDPQWEKFSKMIAAAAAQAKADGRRTVLGGMIPVDHHWLNLIKKNQAFNDIDVVAIHGFPEMWWSDFPCWDWPSHWRGWHGKVAYITQSTEGRPVWITETGLATWDLPRNVAGRYSMQCNMLRKAAFAPVERVYWYSLIDLDPRRDAIEGYHVDENEYHLGLITWDGKPKPAFKTFQKLISTSRIGCSSRGKGRARAARGS